MRRALLVVLVPLLLPVGAEPAGAHHLAKVRFKTICNYVKSLPDDPIVAPGRPGASHLHDFFGNLKISATFHSFSDLQTATTSCDEPQDRAAYWVPSLYVGGRKVNPSRMATYYRLGERHPPIASYPEGLKVIAGWSSADGPSPHAGWQCSRGSRSANPPSTCSGNEWIMTVDFPDCWNGTARDSADHRSHMAHSVRGPDADVCPASHPVPVPELSINAHYRLPAGAKGAQIRLSSGPAFTLHADFLNGWNPARLGFLVDSCLNQQRCALASATVG